MDAIYALKQEISQTFEDYFTQLRLNGEVLQQMPWEQKSVEMWGKRNQTQLVVSPGKFVWKPPDLSAKPNPKEFLLQEKDFAELPKARQTASRLVAPQPYDTGSEITNWEVEVKAQQWDVTESKIEVHTQPSEAFNHVAEVKKLNLDVDFKEMLRLLGTNEEVEIDEEKSFDLVASKKSVINMLRCTDSITPVKACGEPKIRMNKVVWVKGRMAFEDYEMFLYAFDPGGHATRSDNNRICIFWGYESMVYACSALSSAYAKTGCYDEAIGIFESMNDLGLKAKLITHNAQIDASAKGVRLAALMISKSITNSCGTVYGYLWRLEPLSSTKKSLWLQEMEWLLVMGDHSVELMPSWQTFYDGSELEVMNCQAKSNIAINIPALCKLDNMPLEMLDRSESSQKAIQRDMDKWWLALQRIPSDGLSVDTRRQLVHNRECPTQILKAWLSYLLEKREPFSLDAYEIFSDLTVEGRDIPLYHQVASEEALESIVKLKMFERITMHKDAELLEQGGQILEKDEFIYNCVFAGYGWAIGVNDFCVISRISDDLRTDEMMDKQDSAGVAIIELARNYENITENEFDPWKEEKKIQKKLRTDKQGARVACYFNVPKSMGAFYLESRRTGSNQLPLHNMLSYGVNDSRKMNITLRKLAGKNLNSSSFGESSSKKSFSHFRQMIEYCEQSLCRKKRILENFGNKLTSTATLRWRNESSRICINSASDFNDKKFAEFGNHDDEASLFEEEMLAAESSKASEGFIRKSVLHYSRQLYIVVECFEQAASSSSIDERGVITLLDNFSEGYRGCSTPSLPNKSFLRSQVMQKQDLVEQRRIKLDKLFEFGQQLTNALNQAESVVKAQTDMAKIMREMGLVFIKLTRFENEQAMHNTQRFRDAGMKQVSIKWNHVTFQTLIYGLCSAGRTGNGIKIFAVIFINVKMACICYINPGSFILYGLSKGKKSCCEGFSFCSMYTKRMTSVLPDSHKVAESLFELVTTESGRMNLVWLRLVFDPGGLEINRESFTDKMDCLKVELVSANNQIRLHEDVLDKWINGVRRDAPFDEFFQKMDSFAQYVVIKYELPDEDLDALVTVSCADELGNMMDNYQKLNVLRVQIT